MIKQACSDLEAPPLKTPRRTNTAFEYDPMDLINFIQKDFGPLNMMMERAGMSEMDIYYRTKEASDLFEGSRS